MPPKKKAAKADAESADRSAEAMSKLIKHFESIERDDRPSFSSRSTPAFVVRPYAGEAVAALRKKLKLTTQVFAQFLGTDIKTLQSWESGRRPVYTIACRFMEEVEKLLAIEPQFMKRRLREENAD